MSWQETEKVFPNGYTLHYLTWKNHRLKVIAECPKEKGVEVAFSIIDEGDNSEIHTGFTLWDHEAKQLAEWIMEHVT